MNMRNYVFAALALIVCTGSLFAQTEALPQPLRRTLTFQNQEREYFVWRPPKFDSSKQYWVVAAVYANPMLRNLQKAIAASGLDALIISPTFRRDDINLVRFAVSPERDYFSEVIKAVRAEYVVKPRILLTGYSQGAQFAHRYAFAHPDEIEALAPLASGTWTTPNGRLLIEEIGEVRDARKFLSNKDNKKTVPDRLADLFTADVAAVAEIKAVKGTERIPVLVMCGTLDPRLPIAKEFASDLATSGYRVFTEWPRTPHVCARGDQKCGAEFRDEFYRYSTKTVEFFQQVTRAK